MHPTLLVLAFFCFTADSVILFNNEPRCSTDMKIMDVHDGSLFYHQTEYLYFGASYGQCREPDGLNGCTGRKVGRCGFQINHNVSLFRSNDMMHWTPATTVFAMTDHVEPAVMYCPKVIFNVHTAQFVLWYNWLPATDATSFDRSYIAVATSANASGPYRIVNPNLQSFTYGNVGDYDLWVDEKDNYTGYVLYTSHLNAGRSMPVWLFVLLLVFVFVIALLSEPYRYNRIICCLAVIPLALVFALLYGPSHLMTVERLSVDYWGTLGKHAKSDFIGPGGTEAPSLFERNGTYYALVGKTCCYCGEGGPVTYYTASHPLGPYHRGQVISKRIAAQQTQVSKLPAHNGTGHVYVWRGDRWQSAPDRIKGHDFSYFEVLEFNGTTINPMQNVPHTSWID